MIKTANQDEISRKMKKMNNRQEPVIKLELTTTNFDVPDKKENG